MAALRAIGKNPRARGTNPRAKHTAPRDRDENPLANREDQSYVKENPGTWTPGEPYLRYTQERRIDTPGEF